ncbi:MAG: transposase [Desulfobacterium sp.]|nr:transposase [Desulfobacterium sp.]
MNASCQKLLPLQLLGSEAQSVDILTAPSPQILIYEKEYLELKSNVGYWRAMHAKAVCRENILKEKIKNLDGQIRDLRHRLFGKKGEKSSAGKDNGSPKTPKTDPRPRGQQPGSKGHGRTERPDLPAKNEDANFLETPICPKCGKPYINDEDGAKESIRYEVNVKAHVIAPGRGADVPVEYFKNIQQQQKTIVICDRYSAYKSLASQMPFIVLAFCWAHVRRDYLDAARKHPALEEWALYWIEKIGELYHISNLRCKMFNQHLPFQWQNASFKEQHEKLVEKMDVIVLERDEFITSHDPDDPNLDLLTKVKHKILISLKNHWEGLSVFLNHPEVPMDNNPGEKSIRNPVTARKNFYGSGSKWSSQLAAIMFSIFQTLGLWDINSNHWLRAYLTACAENHGKALEDLSDFLPWEIDKDHRQNFSRPPDTS